MSPPNSFSFRDATASLAAAAFVQRQLRASAHKTASCYHSFSDHNHYSSTTFIRFLAPLILLAERHFSLVYFVSTHLSLPPSSAILIPPSNGEQHHIVTHGAIYAPQTTMLAQKNSSLQIKKHVFDCTSRLFPSPPTLAAFKNTCGNTHTYSHTKLVELLEGQPSRILRLLRNRTVRAVSRFKCTAVACRAQSQPFWFFHKTSR